MDISGYSNINTVLSQLQQAKAGQANQTAASSAADSGNSTVSTNNSTSSRTALANSLMQALYQFNSQQGLASWLGEDAQSSGNDFVNQLFSAMPDAGNAVTMRALQHQPVRPRHMRLRWTVTARLTRCSKAYKI